MKKKISVIICAAGKSERAGFNKILAPLYGQPVIFTTCEKFYNVADEIIIACPPSDREIIAAILSPFGAICTDGGSTRFESVYKALDFVTGDIVLIHDGARPFIDRATIENCIDGVIKNGSAICAIPSTDTVVYCDDGIIADVPDRNTIFRAQTPQGFVTKDIKAAYKKAKGDGFEYTDDGSVYRKYVGSPHICAGNNANIKLTYKTDFPDRPSASLPADGDLAVGYGTDVHAFGEGDGVTLCGVKIPCEKKLIAHSDGDVAVHAVMDALLSAAGLKDIGHYFPDNDQKFKSANSMLLLKEVVKLIDKRGYTACNLSLTICAEIPKLAPFIDLMKTNLAKALGVAADNVGISAGTCEGLGFVGQKLGIQTTAMVLLKRKENG